MTSEEDNKIEEDGDATVQGNLLNQPLNEELKTSYINYAMSVIIGRALPDARDGLKPVHSLSSGWLCTWLAGLVCKICLTKFVESL